MFYRRKIILALLQKFGKLGKTQLQKLLLLFTEEQKRSDYQFVPYKYGAYSFSAAADLKAMQKHKHVTISNIGIEKVCEEDFVHQLKEADQSLLAKLYILHSEKSYRELITYTYRKFPYYAIHSAIASRYLSTTDLAKVKTFKPSATKTTLYTIGYEGKSLEGYLNVLINKNILLLIDVRNNPQSMKYGFSKSQLISSCKAVGIDYIHLPEVGIISEQRQQLNSQLDYELLFNDYKLITLKKTLTSQHYILSLLQQYKRVAMTCFEADICQCHRKPLAEAVASLEGWEYDLKHL